MFSLLYNERSIVPFLYNIHNVLFALFFLSITHLNVSAHSCLRFSFDLSRRVRSPIGRCRKHRRYCAGEFLRNRWFSPYRSNEYNASSRIVRFVFVANPVRLGMENACPNRVLCSNPNSIVAAGLFRVEQCPVSQIPVCLETHAAASTAISVCAILSRDPERNAN